MFRDVKPYGQFFLNLGIALKFNTWYSPEILKILNRINDLQEDMWDLKFDESEESLTKNIEIGKSKYEKICRLRDELTAQIRNDFKTIHITDFKKFFGETKR